MRLAVSLLLATSLAAAAVAQTAPALTSDQIIAARQAGYDLLNANAAGIKSAVDGGADVKPLAERARAISAWRKVIPTMFPDGTQQGHDTHALPAIWSDRAGFDKAAANLVEQADKLATIAESGDKDGFKAQFAATGQACGACHRTYRARIN